MRAAGNGNNDRHRSFASVGCPCLVLVLDSGRAGMNYKSIIAAIITALSLANPSPAREDFRPANLSKVAEDLRVFCYVGNGYPHMLSTVTSCNGLDTTGFDLAQWRTILPTAVSLTDDVDGDAINSLIAVSGSNSIVLNLPGQAVINTPITSCSGSIYINGIGQGASITVEKGGVTAFKHCQGSSPPTSSSFQLKNLQIICSAVACGDAMDVKLNNSTEPNFLLDTVSVKSVSGGRWANGALTTGAGGSRITNSLLSLGSSGAISGTCISFVSAAPFTVLIQILNTHFYWCATAEQVTSAAANQGVEGVFNTNVNADQVITFFNYTNTGSYNPPELVFYGTEASFYQSLFSVNLASGTYVSDWIIRDGWYIQLAPNANSGSITAPKGLIDIGAAQRVTIDGNTFTQASGATMNYFINANGSGWQIEHNYAPVLLGTIIGGILQIGAETTEFVERDNDWAYGGTVVTNNAYATVSVASEAYIFFQSSGACQLLSITRRGTISGRRIQCVADLVARLTSGSATFKLPPRIFQGSVPPALVIGNCRSGSTLYLGDTNGTPSFAANQWTYTLLCASGENNTVEVRYIAIGS
jgi:hypothetical protein